MKLLREILYEKFTDDSESDPIRDMGIGHPEIVELQKDAKKISDFANVSNEDLDFKDVIYALKNLKNIVVYTSTFYLCRKYNIKTEKTKHRWGGDYIKYTLKNYELTFDTSISGMSITITFYKNNNYQTSTTQCRSIKRLELAFLKACKELNIKL